MVDSALSELCQKQLDKTGKHQLTLLLPGILDCFGTGSAAVRCSSALTPVQYSIRFRWGLWRTLQLLSKSSGR